MISEQDLKKMYWHSRRGMLELDLILVPFATGPLAGLGAEQQEQYRSLLEEEDQDLFAWLVHRQPPPAELESIVRVVLESRPPRAT